MNQNKNAIKYNNSMSYAKILFNYLKLNKNNVYNSRDIEGIFHDDLKRKISTNYTSTILNRLFRKGHLLRTPTQLTNGYAYSYSNKKKLDEKYYNYIVPKELKNISCIYAKIIEPKYSHLLCSSKLELGSINDDQFLKRDGKHYFIKKKIHNFLAENVAFLMFDGHLDKNLSCVKYFFRYDFDAQIFIKNFKEVFRFENILLGRTKYCYHAELHSKNYALLMNKLGVPKGNKVHQGFQVPDWIYHGNKEIKRNFLSVAYGNEGSAPTNNRWRIQFVLSKSKKHIPEHLYLLTQIKNMLFYFGIDSSHIQLRKQNKGNRQYYGRFYIKGIKNLIRFHKLLEFSYASEKQKVLEDLLERHNHL